MLDIDTIFNRWQSKWVVGLLETFLLYVVKQKDRYGGELVKLSRLNVDKNAKVPTIYGILNRYSELGLITEVSENSEEGVTRGTSRKYYAITDLGNNYLNLMIARISSLQPILEFNSKLIKEEK